MLMDSEVVIGTTVVVVCVVGGGVDAGSVTGSCRESLIWKPLQLTTLSEMKTMLISVADELSPLDVSAKYPQNVANILSWSSLISNRSQWQDECFSTLNATNENFTTFLDGFSI